MPTLPSLRHQEASESGQPGDRDHVALDLAPTPTHSQAASLPGMLLEPQTLGREASMGRLAEGPAPPVAPAVAAAMATSYFSELGLDDIPQVIPSPCHKDGRTEPKLSPLVAAPPLQSLHFWQPGQHNICLALLHAAACLAQILEMSAERLSEATVMLCTSTCCSEFS